MRVRTQNSADSHTLWRLARVDPVRCQPAAALAVVGIVGRACVPLGPAANVVLDGKVGVVSNLEDAVHRSGEYESRGRPLFQRVGPAERNAGRLGPPAHCLCRTAGLSAT